MEPARPPRPRSLENRGPWSLPARPAGGHDPSHWSGTGRANERGTTPMKRLPICLAASVLAASTVMVALPSVATAVVPGPGPAQTLTIGTGPGSSPGCAGVFAYDGIPFVGGGNPTGGSIGPINGGSVSVTTDFVPTTLTGKPAATRDHRHRHHTVTAPRYAQERVDQVRHQAEGLDPDRLRRFGPPHGQPPLTNTASGKIDAGDLKTPNPKLSPSRTSPRSSTSRPTRLPRSAQPPASAP